LSKHITSARNNLIRIIRLNNTGYTQKNGAVSKVNKEFISHLTQAQRTPSAAATVQVSHALPAVRFSCLLRGRRASFQDGVAAGKGIQIFVLCKFLLHFFSPENSHRILYFLD